VTETGFSTNQFTGKPAEKQLLVIQEAEEVTKLGKLVSFISYFMYLANEGLLGLQVMLYCIFD